MKAPRRPHLTPTALYRASLRFYPPEFRELYADEMVRVLSDAWEESRRRRGLPAACLTWIVMVADAIGHGLLEHLRPCDPELIFEPSAHTQGGFMEALLRDVRFAVRGLARRGAFTLTAVITLAVTIGFNATLFSVVQGVLLDPLPYPDSQRLLVLRSSHPEQGIHGVSALDYLDWRRQVTLVESMAAYQHVGLTDTGGEEPVYLDGIRITPGLFTTLAAEPALGRSFSEEEGVAGNHRVAMISHDFWQSRFGGSPNVLGNLLELDETPYEIVGVMPAGFEFPPDHDTRVWTSLAFDVENDAHDADRGARGLYVVGRLADGIAPERARQELDAAAATLAAQYPATNTGWGVRAERVHDQLVGDVKAMLLVLLGAAGLLLVIACANLANLTLVRLAARRREIAVRTGLGATRAHLLRQFLTESLLLSVAGGAAGLILALAGVSWVRGFSHGILPRLGSIELDFGVVAFTLALCLLTTLLFGLTPALRACAAPVAEHLRTHTTHPHASRRLFSSLVVSQVALALALTVGAGLMARSFLHLSRVDPGFQARNVLAASFYLPWPKYQRPQIRAFSDRMLEEVAAAPGVLSAGAVSALPLDEVARRVDNPHGSEVPFTIEGRPGAEGEEPWAEIRVATPGYFETLRIPLIRGRLFDERDREGAPRILLVNETMARQYFAGTEAVGRFVDVPLMGGRHQVVGVVADLRHYGLSAEARPEMYAAFDQRPFRKMTVVAQTSGPPAQYVNLMRRAAREADPNQAIDHFTTLRSLLEEVLFVPRLHMTVLGLFAFCSCLLAATGLYGVMTSRVAERSQELGIRLALGARNDDVMWMVVRQGMALAAVGIAVGLAVSAALTRVLESLLFEVNPLDTSVVLSACLGFALVALAANLLPALRAMRLDPVETLARDSSRP